MSRRSLYTVVTPLPPTISRATAIEVLHNHGEMIELNPLVINHTKCKPPPNAPADEFHCTWYELTDKITYLPGIKGTVNYKACFHDLPTSIQTHVYAPAGLEIKEKWSIGGNEPHEEREVIEIGMAALGVPRSGLYLREDVDMKCNIFLTNFVKRTLRRAHEVLVERLVIKADLADDRKVRNTYTNHQGSRGAGSSIYSSDTHSTADHHRSPSNMGLSRVGSVRSEAASTSTTSPTIVELPAQYIVELPDDQQSLANMMYRKSQDGGKLGTSPPLKQHPCNAYGIPPPAPIEME